MSETQPRLRTFGIAIAAVGVLLVLLGPILFLGESPSLLSLLFGAASLLGAGLLIRMQGGAARTVGTVLVIVGIVSLVLVVGLLVVVLASWGP